MHKVAILVGLLSLANYQNFNAMDDNQSSCKDGTCTPVSEEKWEQLKQESQEFKHKYQELEKTMQISPVLGLLKKDGELNKKLKTRFKELSTVSSVSMVCSLFKDMQNIIQEIIGMHTELMKYGIGQMYEDDYKEETQIMKEIQTFITEVLAQEEELKQLTKEQKETIIKTIVEETKNFLK